MFRSQSPERSTARPRRPLPGGIVLWVFVILEALAIGVAIWYMAGGAESR